MMFEGIEFSDRYGGRTPSWLRACRRCDAMGCYPQAPASAYNADGTIDISPGTDDWEFVVCPQCHGSTHCPWLTTARRVPGWLVRGIPFVWHQGIRREFNPDGGRWKSLKIAFGIAYLVDLGLYKP